MKKTIFVAIFSWLVLSLSIFFMIPSPAKAGILSFLIGEPAQADTTMASTTESSDDNFLLALSNANQGAGSAPVSVIDNGALVASVGALGTTADIASSTAATAISLYVVRDGDSLSAIANMFGVSVNTIKWANDITGPIHTGDKLIILPISGVEYTVKKGDTVSSIAKKFSADQDDITTFNGITSNTLAVGTTIIIPDGEMTSTAPVVVHAGTKITDANLPPEPLHNADGPSIPGYYQKPLVSACVSQGLHGYNAVDLAAPKYTPIYAAAAGTVIVAKDNGAWNGGYGNYVVVSHANGTQTLYAHMTTGTVVATQGEEVSEGQKIGEVGMTGEATGPHLHIEVRGAQNPFLNEYPSCY